MFGFAHHRPDVPSARDMHPHHLLIMYVSAAGPTFSPEVLAMLDSKGLEVRACCDIVRSSN